MEADGVIEHGLTSEEITAIAAKLRNGEPLTPEEAGHTAYTLEFLDRDYREVVGKLHKTVERFKIPARPGGNVDDSMIAHLDAQQAVIEAAGEVDAAYFTRHESGGFVGVETKASRAALGKLHAALDALKGGGDGPQA